MDRATFLVIAASGGAGTAGVAPGTRINVVRDRGCTCCEGWAAAMKAAGYTVGLQELDRTDRLRHFRISEQAAGCHTAQVGGYLVEGHVPLAAVAKLLRERPRTRGVALPGMPTGTPGMPGPPVPLRVIFLDDPAREFYSA
jgi:hypothetical protein